VGCARNNKTDCGTGNKAFLIHSGFDLQSSRGYVQYFEQPFCDHMLYIYKVTYFSNSCTLFVAVIKLVKQHLVLYCSKVKIILFSLSF
jgi:hypothetical protein